MPGEPSWRRSPCNSSWTTRLSTAGLPSGQAPAVGIGVHTGVVVVGHLGADPQRVYTAAGDTIALATSSPAPGRPR